MKKKLLSVFLIIFTGLLFAQKAITIESALDSAVAEIKKSVPTGVEIAVSRFSSDSKEMSEWLVQEVETRLIRAGKFTLLERNAKNLQIIDSEIDYQYSGDVDDSSMVELGYRLGAKYLVYGSFEQFGGLMQFTLKTTNVESGEIPVIASYSISNSSKITDLLGDEKTMNSAEDFLDMIARCQKKLTTLKSDKNKEIQNISSNIFAKYQEEINQAKSVEKEPYESTIDYENKIQKNVLAIEGKRDTELSGVESKVNIKYDNHYKMVEIQMNKLIENLENTTFTIKGDSVQILLGEFNPEATPKYWPISIKSLDKLVNYTFNGKRTTSNADVKTEYMEIESARKNNALEGEIVYKLIKGNSSFDYEVKVISVRVNNTENGTTVINENINEIVGSVNASAKLSGKTNYEKPVKKQSAQTENKTTPKKTTTKTEPKVVNNVNVNVTNTVNKTTTNVSKTSTTASISTQKNPFESKEDWSYLADRTGGYCKSTIGKTSFEGETFDILSLSGKTGNGGTYEEMANYNEQTIKNFIKKGKTLKFYVKGDGNTYKIRFRMTLPEKKYSDYGYTFKTKKGEVVEVKIPYTELKHEQWSDYHKFDSTLVNGILLNVENISAKKDYFIQIFDAKVF